MEWRENSGGKVCKEDRPDFALERELLHSYTCWDITKRLNFKPKRETREVGKLCRVCKNYLKRKIPFSLVSDRILVKNQELTH